MIRQLENSKFFWFALFLAVMGFLTFCQIASCQTTNVSATVVDNAGTVWANGTWKLQFLNNSSYPSYVPTVLNSSTPITTLFSGNLDASGRLIDGSGNLFQTVQSNLFASPQNSQWQLTVCPTASSQCGTITQSINGATLDLSSQLTTFIPSVKVSGTQLPYGYNDAEATAPTGTGAVFYNLASGLRCFILGVGWGPCLSVTSGITQLTGDILAGPGSGSQVATLPLQPLIPAIGGVYTKVQVNQKGLVVNGAPITSIDIATAGILSNNTSGNAATSTTTGAFTTSPSQCPSNQATQGITTTGNANCSPFIKSITATSPIVVTPDGLGNINISDSAPAASTRVIQTTNTGTACTTANGASLATCDDIIAWPTAFADGGYYVTCSGFDPNINGTGSGEAPTLNIVLKSIGSVTVRTQTQRSLSAHYTEIDCIAIHP